LAGAFCPQQAGLARGQVSHPEHVIKILSAPAEFSRPPISALALEALARLISRSRPPDRQLSLHPLLLSHLQSSNSGSSFESKSKSKSTSNSQLAQLLQLVANLGRPEPVAAAEVCPSACLSCYTVFARRPAQLNWLPWATLSLVSEPAARLLHAAQMRKQEVVAAILMTSIGRWETQTRPARSLRSAAGRRPPSWPGRPPQTDAGPVAAQPLVQPSRVEPSRAEPSRVKSSQI